MPTAQSAVYLNPDWPIWLPLFVFGWFVFSGLMAIVSGWQQLARRFRSDSKSVGERFGFVSARLIRSARCSANYGACLNVCIGKNGLSLSVQFLYRFMNPPLHIPWHEIASVEPSQSESGSCTVVRIHDCAIVMELYGKAGQCLAELDSALRR